MQEEVTGDALLAHDADYVRSGTPRAYFVYPSSKLPRFVVPTDDVAGLRFSLGIISEPWGIGGMLVRHVAASALGARFLSWILFERATL